MEDRVAQHSENEPAIIRIRNEGDAEKLDIIESSIKSMDENNEPQPVPIQRHTETAPAILCQPKNFPTMFNKIVEKNITFCIDTSGSMYNSLQTVKDHIIEALFQKANESSDSYFNLVEFSSQVTQWSDKVVRCSPQTVAVAAQWITNLQATTGTNLLDALLSAFSDHYCDAVCLVTDGNPDQHPSELLDNVAYVSQNRPIHCYYVQVGEPDPASIEFLQNLAMETYGSFHTISISQSGAIERVIPVYRAESSAERIIRTTQGTVYPLTSKVCSVSTTLDTPTEVIVERQPDVIIQEVNPWYPFHPYPYSLGLPSYYGRYSSHYNIPHQGAWSKWRPTKAWSKFTNTLSDIAHVPPPAPGPGAMVIGTKVLARRNENGFFYLGNVKSQILSDKFLVEFGPCKHGKYKDTAYQETYICDIVSHDDALRHSILPGDKVIAPWEPEGERYGPGVVIDGQERRMAPGGSEDKHVLVTFHNGKTASVPFNTAVWVPPQLHERIQFELQLPSNVRKEFAEQDWYPEHNIPGYPSSGPVADPVEFERHDPKDVQRIDPFVAQNGIYDNPYYVPMYPVYYKYQPRPNAVNSEEIVHLVPGTDMTKNELNEKVMSQLMKYKMSLEDRTERDVQEDERRERLLERREKQSENNIKKSVSFRKRDDDELSDILAEYYSGDLDLEDSGRGSATDLELEDLDKDTRDIGVGTSTKLLYPRQRRSRSPSKPRWQYWNNEPAPDVMEPMHFGPYRVGPYDATACAAPLELRHSRVNKDGLEWQSMNKSSMYDYVDPYAKHRHDVDIYDSMGHRPHPPSRKPEKQGPGQGISECLGEHQRGKDVIRQGRLNYRRNHVLAREKGEHQRREDEWAMKHIMRDQHKQQILAQIEHDRQRQLTEMDKVQQTREAKKQINTQIRVKIESNQEHERQREEQRQTALQNRRSRREDILAQKQNELEQLRMKRQAVKQERAEVRHQAVNDRLASQDAMNAARDLQARQAKVARIHHFRELEEKNQQLRSLQAQSADHTAAVFRSSLIA